MRKCGKALRTGSVCAVLAVWLAGCGRAALESAGNHTAETQQPEMQSPSEVTSSEELPEICQQILLYIREGLCEHGIDGTYQVYFGAVEDDTGAPGWRDGMRREYGDDYFCGVLLEGDGNLWRENLAYSYDPQSGWYTFNGQYEPVLAGDVFWTVSADSEFATDMRNNCAYVCSVSGEMHFPYPVRYRAENGPVERDARVEIPYQDACGDTSYGIWPMLYTYVDERLNTEITIMYPEIYLSDAHAYSEDVFNEQIKDAFFYGYYMEDEELLNPHKKFNTEIERNYIITRRDEDFLSMRIYEYNDFRGANHPNEWETGITIDMHTGKVLRFSDIVGEDWDLEAFIDSGVFRCIWFWENDTGGDWLNHFDRRSSWDSYFYLTDKTLGLITEVSRYYANIEADFEALGISGF